ncbi:hypothetical protein T439DRAFT_156561 [Meredithblackwellia eburnea MCA 4105]
MSPRSQLAQFNPNDYLPKADQIAPVRFYSDDLPKVVKLVDRLWDPRTRSEVWDNEHKTYKGIQGLFGNLSAAERAIAYYYISSKSCWNDKVQADVFTSLLKTEGSQIESSSGHLPHEIRLKLENCYQEAVQRLVEVYQLKVRIAVCSVDLELVPDSYIGPSQTEEVLVYYYVNYCVAPEKGDWGLSREGVRFNIKQLSRHLPEAICTELLQIHRTNHKGEYCHIGTEFESSFMFLLLHEFSLTLLPAEYRTNACGRHRVGRVDLPVSVSRPPASIFFHSSSHGPD